MTQPQHPQRLTLTRAKASLAGKGKLTSVRRRMGRQPDGTGSDWSEWIEPGSVYVDTIAQKVYRAEQSSGWGKRTRGELYKREIKPPLRVGESVELRRRSASGVWQTVGTPSLASAVPERNEKGVWGWRFVFDFLRQGEAR